MQLQAYDEIRYQFWQQSKVWFLRKAEIEKKIQILNCAAWNTCMKYMYEIFQDYQAWM